MASHFEAKCLRPQSNDDSVVAHSSCHLVNICIRESGLVPIRVLEYPVRTVIRNQGLLTPVCSGSRIFSMLLEDLHNV